MPVHDQASPPASLALPAVLQDGHQTPGARRDPSSEAKRRLWKRHGFSRETRRGSSVSWACLHVPAALGSVDVAHFTSAEHWQGATDTLQDNRSLQVF